MWLKSLVKWNRNEDEENKHEFQEQRRAQALVNESQSEGKRTWRGKDSTIIGKTESDMET
jgi:hypothetical protein